MRYHILVVACLLAPPANAEDPLPTGGPRTIFGSWVSDSAVLVAVPDEGGSIHAFSTRTGRWLHQTLEFRLPSDAVPLVSGEMAVIQTKETIYAIGSRMNKWAILKLKNAGTNAVLSGSNVRVEDGRHLYMLGSNSEHWEGVDLETGSVLLPQYGG